MEPDTAYIDWEISRFKYFHHCRTMTKIRNANIFYHQIIRMAIIRMAIYLSPPCVKGEDGSAASPIGDLSDRRGLLSSCISAKAIAEVISKHRR